MPKAIEAVVEQDGRLRLLEDVSLPLSGRVRILILDEDAANETALLSEHALAQDWDRKEEQEAWQHLEREP